MRVNQVGYPATASKRAYLMTSGAASTASFAVRERRRHRRLTAAVGAQLGSWSTELPQRLRARLPASPPPARYTIAVTGPVAGRLAELQDRHRHGASTAAPWRNALSYYQAPRDGAGYIPSAMRTAPGHLNDAHAMTYLTRNANSAGRFSGDLTPLGVSVDASGGWWDAGDYLKFVQTPATRPTCCCRACATSRPRWAPGRPRELHRRGPVRRRLAAADVGRPARRTLYYQVGIGSGNAKTIGDHDIWRLPQADDGYGGTDPLYRYIRNRPVFRAGPPGAPISPNLAGRDAAALAAVLPGLQGQRPGFREPLPARGRAHLRPGQHGARADC